MVSMQRENFKNNKAPRFLMNFREVIKKEKEVWHERFIPSLVAGVSIAIIALFFELSEGNIVMFASVGASAVILVHKERAHLTKLKTILLAYILASGVSLLIFYASYLLNVPIQARILVSVTLTSFLLYSFNVFHPPAVSAGVSFLIFHRPVLELLALISSVLMLFVLVRLSMYIFSQRFTLREFVYEFLHEEYVKVIGKKDDILEKKE